MNFETLKRLSKIEKDIDVLRAAIATLQAAVDEIKKPKEEKRPILSLRKSHA